MLAAVRTWARVILTSRGRLTAIGDALGVLSGAARFKSSDPCINLVFMELALTFAPRGAAVDAIHIWSEENHLADALSRIGEGATVPPCLAKVPSTPAVLDGWRILGKTPTPPRRPKRGRDGR